MELRAYLEILWRRKWVILTTAVVTTLVIMAGVSLLPPTYEATTTLRVAPSGGWSIDYTALTYATQLKNTFLRLATSDKVLDDLTERLDLDIPPKVEIELLGNSELMLLTVQHQDRQVAQDAANTLAEILLEMNQELYVGVLADTQQVLHQQLLKVESEMQQAWDAYQQTIVESPDDAMGVQAAGRAWELKEQEYTALFERLEATRAEQVMRANALSVFDPAELPVNPAGLPGVVYLALGAMVGVTAGIALALLFENLDTTLRTSEQIETVTKAPIVGRIPPAGKKDSAAFPEGRALDEEAIRRLRTNLHVRGNPTPLAVILIASAEPQEGKTTILANLACAFAESGRQVVAVDCDMRRPTLHTVFGLQNDIGLSSVLQKHVTLGEALQTPDVNGPKLLCSGPATSMPTELLGSQASTDLLEALRERFDVVLIDTPAIAAVVDAAILAPKTDGVLLIVERARAKEEAVRIACQQLGDVGARLIGVVVNKAGQLSSYGYYAGYQRSQPHLARELLTKLGHAASGGSRGR
jgi:capsular exopolysaccharide synthesis family protein